MTDTRTSLPTHDRRLAGRFLSQVVAAFAYCAIPFGAPIDARVIARMHGQQPGAAPDPESAVSVAAIPGPRAGEHPTQLRATPQSAFAEH